MSGQGHKLVELVPREEGADFIVGFSLWAHIEITDDERGFLKVDELIQEMSDPEQRFLLGAVYRDDIQIFKGDFPKLNEWLADVVIGVGGNLVLDINSDTFSWSHTGEVTSEAFQVILLSLFFFRMEPYLLQAKYVTLQECRITLDVINVTAEGLHIEGADLETSSSRIHPVTGLVVNGHLLNSLGLSFNILVHPYLVWVHLVQDTQLIKTAAPREHDIHHAWLVSTDHVNHQRVWLRHRLSLKKRDFNHKKLEPGRSFKFMATKKLNPIQE